MDTQNIKIEDLKKADKATLLTTENQVRRQLAELRMDIYTPASAHVAKKRKLKKSLARLLTVKTSLSTKK